jgi:hypothetical protein
LNILQTQGVHIAYEIGISFRDRLQRDYLSGRPYKFRAKPRVDSNISANIQDRISVFDDVPAPVEIRFRINIVMSQTVAVVDGSWNPDQPVRKIM